MAKSHYNTAHIHPRILRQIEKANDLDWNETHPLKITYGTSPVIIATGAVFKELADELMDAGLLRMDGDGVLSLNLRKDLPSADDVTTYMKKIEAYCITRKHIKGLRGERLHLGDKLMDAKREHYASYDRNLDVLGLMVHTVCVITYQIGGKRNGHLVVAKRNPIIVAAKGDSTWDVLSGAIAYGDTSFQTRASEGFDEYGLSQSQMRRAKSIGVITTNRTRENHYSIVRETIQVSALGLSPREIQRLACHDIKTVTITDDKGIESVHSVKSNDGFVIVSPHKVLTKLKTRKHLKNGKALAMMRFLSSHHMLNTIDLPHSVLSKQLAPQARTYCRINHKWIRPSPSPASRRRTTPTMHLVM